MSVFRVSSDFKTIVNPDAAKLVPELKTLSEGELIFCVLAVDDVDGPFRKKPETERMIMASKRFPSINPNSARMKVAMEGYKSLIFDRRRKTIEVLQYRYELINREIESDLSLSASKMSDRLKMQEMLSKRIEAIQNEIDVDEMAYELKGNKRLSLIEQWQMSQKKYAEFTNAL